MTLMSIPCFQNSAGKNCQIQKARRNGLVPEYLTSKFVTRNESNYALGDSVNQLVVLFPRTNYMKYSFSYSGTTLWKSLPCNMREFGSLNQFKHFLHHNCHTAFMKIRFRFMSRILLKVNMILGLEFYA